MESVIVIAGLICVFVIGSVYARWERIRRAYRIVRKKFGRMPEPAAYDYKEISMYWNAVSEQALHPLDDLTWDDLDMNQIYERMNQCESFAGEQYLYALLRNISQDTASLEKMEEKMRYMEDNEREREEAQVKLMALGKRDSSYYLPQVLDEIEDFQIGHSWFYRLLQALLFLSLAGAVILRNGYGLTVFGMIFICNLCIYAVMKQKYEIHLELMESVRGLIYTGRELTKGTSGGYEKRFGEISMHVAQLGEAEKRLRKATVRRQAGMQGDAMELFATYLTGATLIDFTMYNQAIRQLKRKMEHFKKVYRLVGELDALISVVSFRKSLPLYCLPKFSQDSCVHLEGLYHPLLKEPVLNDVVMVRNSIVTGSNASGKSTFIKAVTVNCILAQTIHTCMAGIAEIPHAYIATSMAVKDSLMEGESYYMKEIRSLNRMLGYMQENELVICAIDEILRGTNTKERIAASAAILRYLEERNCLVLVASHDMELVKLLDREYEHYYFCEQEGEDDIVFDYKIHRGINEKTNAIRLLEYVGFPGQIVSDAERIYRLLASE